MESKYSKKPSTGPQVLKKAEDQVIGIMATIKSYPKVNRYNLGERTEQALLDGIQDIYYATFIPEDRLKRLKSARVHFQMMLFLFRLARRQKPSSYISEEYYKNLSLDFDEIGKMLSGWIETEQRKLGMSAKSKVHGK